MTRPPRIRHVTTGWLARLLGSTHQTIRAMAQRGELPRPITIGRSYRWPLQRIMEYAREHGIDIPPELL